MEQPNIDISETDQVSEPITNCNKESTNADIDKGSTLGKFKDATSLLEAYNNLQKEFTRKSQKLASLTKEMNLINSKKVQNHYEINEKTIQNINLSQSTIANTNTDINTQEFLNSKVTLSEHSTNSNTNSLNPLYRQKNWNSLVSKFFNKNPEAKKYSAEISSMLIHDKVLASSDNCLEYAYASIKQNNSSEPADLLSDPSYFSSIISNEKVKEKIISNYLEEVRKNKANLKLISGEPNYISPTPPQSKPKNLKEASNMLRKILQS